MATVEDGFSFRWVEGSGIRRLFSYSLPCDCQAGLPSRQTNCRDVDLLYEKLKVVLKAKIKVRIATRTRSNR